MGFNLTSLKVFKKSPGNPNYTVLDNYYSEFDLPAVELDIFTRLYIYKNFYLKPSLNYSRSNYYKSDDIIINNGTDILFYASLSINETVKKIKVFLPLGFGLPKRRFNFFAEGGFGYNPFLNVKDEIDYRIYKIDTNVFKITNSIDEIVNFIPSNLNFSRDIGRRVFFKCTAGLSIKLSNKMTFNTSYSIERSNYYHLVYSPTKLRWKYRYEGISFGLMYAIR